VQAVVRGKVEAASCGSNLIGIRARAARTNISNESSALAGAVATPELVSVTAVVGVEVDLATPRYEPIRL